MLPKDAGRPDPRLVTEIRYRLSDGREFGSPSAAGTAVTGKACNGWAFWTVGDGSETKKPAKSGKAATGSTITPAPKPETKRRGRKSQTAEQAPAAEGPDWRRGARRRAPSRPGGRWASNVRRVRRDFSQRRRRHRALLRDARQAEGDEPTA